MNNVSNRQAVCEVLMELAQNDRNIIVLTSDSRGSAGLTAFAEAFPDQFIEVGIAEQNLVGIAAGLANSGKKPVAASPASFLSMRSAEQIKVDVAYSRSKVLLLGISGGMSYGALGMSHHSLQDIAAMSAIPGIDVILPADRFETDSIIRDIMMNPRPAYVRIGRNPVPDVFESREKTGYVPGKATVVHDGNDAAIISCGELVYAAKKAADLLDKEGVHVKVIDMHTIKPTDEKVICEAADTGFILTMEEHSTYGGLGSLAARIVSEYKPVQVKVLAIPDEPVVSGKSEEVYSYYGLNAENAAAIIRNNLKSRIG